MTVFYVIDKLTLPNVVVILRIGFKHPFHVIILRTLVRINYP
jgi:hypothetical protein